MITSEPMALLRIFEDSDLKAALTAFFEAQSVIENKAAADMMGGDRAEVDAARKHACYAKAYEEAMNRLRAYVRQV